MEVELKLLIAPTDVAAFRRLALLRQFTTEKPRSLELRGTYFDTPQFRLRSQGMQLRVRRAEGVWIETLKAGEQPLAGLYGRQEWETRVDGPQPDLAALAALVGAGSKWHKVLIEPALAKGLTPVFDSVFRRTVWPLRLPQGTFVELALDQGELRHGDVREPISELELELKAGEPAALFDFALQLQAKVALRVGNLSKSARGYALCTPKAASATVASSFELASDMTVEQGFRAIVSHCVTQIQDNESGVVGSNDPESVHQMRIGMRRLHSALRLFHKWVLFPVALQGELDWLAGVLGAARDAHVLAESTLVKVAQACSKEAELSCLKQAASAAARAKRRRAQTAVGSVRYSRLMLGIVAWLQSSRWHESLSNETRDALAAPLDKLAAKVLVQLHQKLRKSARGLKDGSPEKLHRMRIAAKKARYALKFFQGPHPSRRAERYIDGLTELQDALGWLNDAAVADGLLREIEKSHLELATSTGFARGFLCARATLDARELADLWARFSAIKLP